MKAFLQANSENWYFNHIVKIHCKIAVDFLILHFCLVLFKHSVTIPNKGNLYYSSTSSITISFALISSNLSE